MPTLLEATGLPVPNSVDGSSVLPLAQGNPDVEWREYIHGEHAYGEHSYHYLTDGRVKYIWYSQTGVEQLFDLSSDPTELNNLAADSKQEAALAVWRRRLIEQLIGREEGYTDGEQLIVGQEPQNCLSHIVTS